MHDQTKAELVDGGTSLIGTLLKDLLTRRTQREQMEQRKEMEVELAKVRQEHAPDDDDQPADAVQPAQNSRGEPAVTQELRAAFEELKANEECSTCRQLLEPIAELPPRQQLHALTEYGRFKQAMEGGADKDELEAIIRDSDTLSAMFNESMGVG